MRVISVIRERERQRRGVRVKKREREKKRRGVREK